MSMPGLLIDLLDDLESRERITQPPRRLATESNVLEELGELRAPRIVSHRVLPHGRLRRSHLGRHPVPRDLLGTVAAAQAFDMQLAVAAVDLHRERILPLGGARVQPR